MNPQDVFPKEFLERLARIVPAEKYEAVLLAFTDRRPSVFRANTLKITPHALRVNLQKEGIEVETVAWNDNAFVLKGTTQRVLMETELYKQGFLYLQNLSSMIPPLVVDPQRDETILDITAAPGSKTTQMAAIMQNTGTIIANDKSRIRLYKLEANLKMQGVTNTKVTYRPAEMFWKINPESFDKALVDVPCSMEGRMHVESEKTYKDWSMRKIKELVGMQRHILRSAVSSTKPGGTIIYSTCTLAPEEDEGVVDWLLTQEKGAVEVEQIALKLPNAIPGLTQWNTKTFDPQMARTLRILPGNHMEGFYVAKLKKLRSTVPTGGW